MKAIELLKILKLTEQQSRFPNVPAGYVPIPKYEDRTANGLTRCVIDWINLNGGQAERISNQGGIKDTRQKTVDSVGFNRVFGSITRIPSTMTRGTADVSATVRGRSVKIEIKIGADRQSEHQIKYQQQIEAAGGVYIIARDFETFVQWYNEFVK